MLGITTYLITMPIDRSHRLLFQKYIIDDGNTDVAAARKCKICVKTSKRRRVLENGNGPYMPQRRRAEIDGVMSNDVQQTLLFINGMNRTLYHDELAELLFQATGEANSTRRIRQCLHRRNFVNIQSSHQAPLERDEEMRRFWVDATIYANGPIQARHLLYVDESHKKNKDANRRYVNCPRGNKVTTSVMHRNSGNAASIIASISIEGVQHAIAVDVNAEGNIDAELFLHIFTTQILPTCEPFPGDRGIVVMDNAAIHMKALLDAAAAAVGVYILYLPPYSFDLNPIELLFNLGKQKLQRLYGSGPLHLNAKIGDLFSECLFSCIGSNDITCNMFRHCFIPVFHIKFNFFYCIY